MGVVLNRPLGKRLGELSGEFALSPLASVPLFSGGPVKTDQLVLSAWQTRVDGFRLHFGIEPEKALQLLSEEGTHVRGFLGYSGWSAGQLEDELSRNGWLTVDADPAIIFDTPVEQRYERALALLGFDPRMLSQEAGHA